ncbi:MAG: hypothetical protein A2487_15230 [Candidatus Raymondbacteria bacterium RifOxyC12_full_50_8]|nr:MAG: hypothetical protein A2350_10625 [Candidatus Raymondbacteria bacterium RifOxyB12_full_50_8]OGJ91990.1 MAG: hypothetical protein A2248_09450 [Candidatus Raymondbacteria bacterium RIFOXYA2_FULL_49_16]OGJ96342.1 MAG: hypothetical protein A2453_08440 [Candidatus Raymondbacteria bacterium RIFOXYC2_FULL_50_21]OGK03723.1 MAG: hypothetical protein A2487_15230 [Candidatus Raymondbacteria bacterium RifOxyC12_full_50_8]OGP44034.1 MAG: hypothetical protein A2324_14100 [Candidatus Raymondbacteria ba
MNSRERVKAAIEKKMPDRLPIDLLWPRAETIRALQKHFRCGAKEEVLRALDIDFRWIPVLCQYPEYEKTTTGKLEGDAPGAGRRYIFHDKQTFEDHWGIVQRVGDDGKYVEWKDGPLAGKEDLGAWSLPHAVYPSIEEIAGNIQPFKNNVVITEIEFPFKIAWHVCGYEHFMMQMVLNPDFVHKLYDHLYAFQEKKACIAAHAGYDIIALVGDIAGQNGMFFSPEMFDQYDRPRFTHLINSVKAIRPDIKIFFHSDGDVEPAIPSLIQCGVDILNPVQSACMDPAKIKKMYGDRLTFHGAISVQDTVPFGSAKDVRNEVIKRIQTVGYNGGYIVSPENSIPFDAPLENILAIYDAVKSFDYHSLKNYQGC